MTPGKLAKTIIEVQKLLIEQEEFWRNYLGVIPSEQDKMHCDGEENLEKMRAMIRKLEGKEY